MGLPAEKIITEALQLPATLRALVAERLIESLDLDESEAISPQWRAELTRRCQEIDSQAVELVTLESVMARANAALK